MIARLLKDHHLLRSTGILVSGTGISHVVALVFQLVIRRIFEPGVFGSFAVYLSVFSILASVSTLKYEMAMVLPRDEKDSRNLAALSFLINLLFTLLVGLAMIFFFNGVGALFGLSEEHRHWLLWMPAAIFLFGNYSIMEHWLIRNNRYKGISLNKIFRRTSEGGGQTLFGFMGQSLGLIWGNLVGLALNNITGLRYIRHSGFHFAGIGRKGMKQVLVRYINFPGYQGFPHLLNMLSLMLPVIIVNIIYTQEQTGWFDLTRQVLALPLALISTSVSKVILKEVSDRRKAGRPVKSMVMKTAFSLLLLAVPMIIVLTLWAEPLFGFVFGASWTQSGSMAGILVFSYVARFVVSPLNAVFSALERMRAFALVRLLNFLLILSLFLLRDYDVYVFLSVYMLMEVFIYSLYFVNLSVICNRYDKTLA